MDLEGAGALDLEALRVGVDLALASADYAASYLHGEFTIINYSLFFCICYMHTGCVVLLRERSMFNVKTNVRH